MELTPSQLSSLNEMGIPVWELRTDNTEQVSNEPVALILQAECLVLLESHSNEQQVQHLLQAMLFAIGLNADQFSIISSDQLPQLQDSSVPQKLLLVFGESFAQSLWGRSAVRGTQHKMLDTQVPTIVSFSLDELLVSPENKILAWQDLQLAKQILNAV
ncbi:MAG: DNA polymerase III subunit psi [Methylophagaceae bacterium]